MTTNWAQDTPVIPASATPEHTRRQIAELTGQLWQAQRTNRLLRADHDSLVRDRDRTRAALGRIERSRSYRLGRALVMLARHPLRVPGHILRRLQRDEPARSTVPPVKRVRAASSQPAPLRKRPTYVYVALGLPPGELRTFLRAVAQFASVSADHVPVVVTDSPSFSLLRNVGVFLEYVPDAESWQRHDGVGGDPLLRDRLARVLEDHDAVRTVVVDPSDPPGLRELIAAHRG